MPLYELAGMSAANKQRHTEPQSDDQEASTLDHLLREACRAGCDLSGVQRAIDGLGAVVSDYTISSQLVHQDQEPIPLQHSFLNDVFAMPPLMKGYFVTAGITVAGMVATMATDKAQYCIIGWVPLFALGSYVISSFPDDQHHHNL